MMKILGFNLTNPLRRFKMKKDSIEVKISVGDAEEALGYWLSHEMFQGKVKVEKVTFDVGAKEFKVTIDRTEDRSEKIADLGNAEPLSKKEDPDKNWGMPEAP